MWAQLAVIPRPPIVARMENDMRDMLMRFVFSPPESVDGPALFLDLAKRWSEAKVVEVAPGSPDALFYQNLLVSTASVRRKQKKQKKRGTVEVVGTSSYKLWLRIGFPGVSVLSRFSVISSSV